MSLFAATLVSWWASQLVPYDAIPVPRIQPAKPAFGIWLALYGLLFALSLRDSLPPPRLWWLCGSLLCTVLWSGAARARAWHLAALCLATASACAWAAVGDGTLLARAAIGLYAGWLGVATALAVAISVPALDGTPLLVAAVAAIAALCAAMRTPWPLASVAWAVLFLTR